MIDLHCHILPNFDDGAADIEESLNMAMDAIDSGTTGIVATSHFMGEASALPTLMQMDRRFSELKEAFQKAKLDLDLYPGAEILCLPETPRLARQRMLPTLGNTNFILCEFYFEESPVYMNEMLSYLADRDYRIIVAHPERYQAVQRDPMLLEHWIEQGYVLQMNKGSILGTFGNKVQHTATQMLGLAQVHLIASDAHGADRRTADMRPIRAWLAAHCPPHYSELLLEENSHRILQNLDPISLREWIPGPSAASSDDEDS
jgi:protein-tyrosine phosphatase